MATFIPALDGFIIGSNAVYTVAQDTGTTVSTTDTTNPTGQRAAAYGCCETFLSFDTSSIPAGATVTSAKLSVSYQGIDGAIPVGEVSELYYYDWSTTLTVADFRSDDALTVLYNASGLLASISPKGKALNTYHDLTSTAAFLTAIQKGAGAYTRLVLASKNHRTSVLPTTYERAYIWNRAQPQPPVLTVEYTTGAPVLEAVQHVSHIDLTWSE